MMKVLIADDDPVSLALLVDALSGTYELHTARDGDEALRRMAEVLPDLALLDVMMPDKDGLEVCRAMRERPGLAEIPVIFVTAVDSPEGEQRGLELGAVDYVTKPVNLKLLLLRVKNQLELRRQRAQIGAQNELLTAQKAALEATLARVKRLEGIISICMYCKKIRTEDSHWEQLEHYISTHSDALFSHGLCPTCERTRVED